MPQRLMEIIKNPKLLLGETVFALMSGGFASILSGAATPGAAQGSEYYVKNGLLTIAALVIIYGSREGLKALVELKKTKVTAQVADKTSNTDYVKVLLDNGAQALINQRESFTAIIKSLTDNFTAALTEMRNLEAARFDTSRKENHDLRDRLQVSVAADEVLRARAEMAGYDLALLFPHEQRKK